MAGGWDAALAGNRLLLESLSLASWLRGIAVDLGCGSGFQSIPLAEVGFEVVTLDPNGTLLAELSGKTTGQPVQVVKYDLLNFSALLRADAALIVCMGDTLPHLASINHAKTLVRTAVGSSCCSTPTV